MKACFKLVTVACVILIAVVSAGAAEYDYIDISNPFLRKLPIAVPLFKQIEGGETSGEVARTAADMLANGLDFTGYFKILDRKSFLVQPKDIGIITSNINFQNWTAIGAEMLITGGFTIDGDIVEMELRLFDTFKQRMLVGKKYKGWVKDLRTMIHLFCGEVIQRLTGNKGVYGSKIAFVSNGTGNKEIYTCEFDGYQPQPFTKNGSINLSPAWSSDGQWIAYTSYLKNNPDLYIRNTKEKRGAIVSKKGLNTSPAWVPGQFALAASLSFSGDPEIYMLTGSGKIIKRITHSRDIDISPTWSPDGKHLAFVSRRSGSPQIYIQEVETGDVRRLTFQGRYNTQPSWSPKGDKIAYSSMQNGQIDIFVVDVEGENTVQLTQNAGQNESPSWSPDGSMIVFSSNREGPSRIYVMTAFGTDQRRLLALPGEQMSPRWSPVIGNR